MGWAGGNPFWYAVVLLDIGYWISIDIYIYREREIDIDIDRFMNIYMYMLVYIYGRTASAADFALWGAEVNLPPPLPGPGGLG